MGIKCVFMFKTIYSQNPFYGRKKYLGTHPLIIYKILCLLSPFGQLVTSYGDIMRANYFLETNLKFHPYNIKQPGIMVLK